ncbi:hypothetical protein BU24DRAFT_423167 [Aaosphaeria arxii CBS 175.79]|uniref:Uncharacterized protein n=1 Tax=Aaosphaeria arxii CBS 175.79 TaxID=1450172 RepID=A0A6A5XME7_9PLEO|nr:uncharacterized protein BU24DRAFT_423167 [Aaosphaeria arxii CBS 175.79]KAF2014123.1 hypothetical protein BU24DRAFT_423167 [Aaosphaeria arxii CBS 175.79]
MSTTSVANATNPLPTGRAFGGDEFSNNLFSDLAPLLTLFGEQVTKQFLSMSMGWADDVLLAMGPLGIMTVIVSAIRVGGVKTLKAFVGRARESRANAEKEILSSTSNDVCELWSGQEIVRELGNPAGMKDVILLKTPVGSTRRRLYAPAREIEEKSTRVLDINTAIACGVVPAPKRHGVDIEDEEIIDISNGAPNIALNVRHSTATPGELWGLAALGTMLQLGALAFPALTTYHWEWEKGGSAIASYGYPCFAGGTVAVIGGMIFCGRVIEGSTTEHEFQVVELAEEKHSLRTASGGAATTSPVQILRLQKACTVSDQHFPSFAIFNSPEDVKIRTSRLNDDSYSRMAALATFTAVVGFVVQFVGLRALHWSATIVQLGVMLIMTVIRSWVRRGLAADPVFYPLLDGHELAWLTLYMLRQDDQQWINNNNRSAKGTVSRIRSCFSLSSIPFSLIKTFPFVRSRGTSEQKPKPLSDQRLLDSIARWEPVTGYFNIQETIRSMSQAIESHRAGRPVIDVLETEITRLHRIFPRDLSRISFFEPELHGISVFPPLETYRDLQNLMPASEHVMDTANALAQAMERTLAFFATNLHVLWKEDGDLFLPRANPWDSPKMTINIDVLRGPYKEYAKLRRENVLIELLRQNFDPTDKEKKGQARFASWRTERETLASFLSLWLFALEIRRTAALKTTSALRPLIQRELVFPVTLISRSNQYFRVICPDAGRRGGRTTNTTHQQTIQAWLQDEVEQIPFLYGNHSDYVAKEMSMAPGNTWLAWGVQFSTPGRVPFGPERVYEGDNWEPGHDLSDLAVRTRANSTLLAGCALEIFSYFFEAIARRIERLGGTTQISLPARENLPRMEMMDMPSPVLSTAADGGQWSNSVIDAVATICVATGIAQDTGEALTVILPGIIKHDLLPTEPHGVEFELLRRDESETDSNDDNSLASIPSRVTASSRDTPSTAGSNT